MECVHVACEQQTYFPPKIAVFPVFHQILISKTKEPLKVLFLSGVRGSYFISVCNFPAQSRPSFGNPRISNLGVVAVRDIN